MGCVSKVPSLGSPFGIKNVLLKNFHPDIKCYLERQYICVQDLSYIGLWRLYRTSSDVGKYGFM